MEPLKIVLRGTPRFQQPMLTEALDVLFWLFLAAGFLTGRRRDPGLNLNKIGKTNVKIAYIAVLLRCMGTPL